ELKTTPRTCAFVSPVPARTDQIARSEREDGGDSVKTPPPRGLHVCAGQRCLGGAFLSSTACVDVLVHCRRSGFPSPVRGDSSDVVEGQGCPGARRDSLQCAPTG